MEQSLPQLVLPIKIERSSEPSDQFGRASGFGGVGASSRRLEGSGPSSAGSEVRARISAAGICASAGVDAARRGEALGGLAGVGGGARGARAVGLGGGAGRRDG